MARRSTSVRLRAKRQSASFGADVKASRINLAMSRQQVADRAGVSWATETAIEVGAPSARLETMCAVAEAVGLDLVIRTYIGRQPTLRDSGQLRHAELLVAQAHQLWQPQVELSVGPHGEAVDLAFFGPSEILDFEIERSAGDFQGQYRRADSKRLMLAAMHRRPVRLVLVIEDTPRNRAAVAPHEGLIRTALPAGSREVLASLRTGTPLGRDGLLWFRPRRFEAGDPADK